MIFRRVVEAGQLKGVKLREALKRYDCFDDATGDLVAGDRYHEVPVDRRIWARHRVQARRRPVSSCNTNIVTRMPHGRRPDADSLLRSRS